MNFRSKIALAALLFAAVGVRANIVPDLSSVTSQGGGEYLYDYTVNIDNGTTVNFNNYFTIYDIYGLTSVSTAPTSWTASTPDLGETPVGAAPPDNGSVLNITWTYTGGPSIVGPDQILHFDFFSTQGNFTAPTDGYYSYDAIESDNDNEQSGVSTVSTPQAPEPASMGVVAVIAMLGMWRRK